MKVYLCYSTHYDYDAPEKTYLNKIVRTEQKAKEWVEFMRPETKRPYSSTYYYEEQEVED